MACFSSSSSAKSFELTLSKTLGSVDAKAVAMLADRKKYLNALEYIIASRANSDDEASHIFLDTSGHLSSYI
jgi:hypothetical protein